MLNKLSKPIDMNKNVKKSQALIDEALKLLREAREDVNRPTKFGGRELSEAITCFETGSMWMNRAMFADKPYSPIIPTPDDKEEKGE